MSGRGVSDTGRGGSGGYLNLNLGQEFGNDFIGFKVDTSSGYRGRGRGRKRGAFVNPSAVFAPQPGRGGRGGFRGGVPPASANGRGSPAPRGRGSFQPPGRGAPGSQGQGRGNFTPGGRGGGFGYADRGYGNGASYRNRLLEPIKFVTGDILFKDDVEDIFKAEVVDLEQADETPTADAFEAAFTEELDDEQESEEDTSEDESDSESEPDVLPEPSTNIPRPQPPSLEESLKLGMTVYPSAAAGNAALQFTPPAVRNNGVTISTIFDHPSSIAAPSFQHPAENGNPSGLQYQAAALVQPKPAPTYAPTSNWKPPSRLSALESQLRSFAFQRTQNMALPAMDKETRRRVTLLAECFGIKAETRKHKIKGTKKKKGKKKGGRTERYVMLTRTKRTGVTIDEVRVARVLHADWAAQKGGAPAFKKAYKQLGNSVPIAPNTPVGNSVPSGSRIKTRDGEIVGQEAVKIGEDNIGHQLLSKMGWSEGAIMGKSGGIVDPLVVVMKMSKLGLGATKPVTQGTEGTNA